MPITNPALTESRATSLLQRGKVVWLVSAWPSMGKGLKDPDGGTFPGFVVENMYETRAMAERRYSQLADANNVEEVRLVRIKPGKHGRARQEIVKQTNARKNPSLPDQQVEILASLEAAITDEQDVDATRTFYKSDPDNAYKNAILLHELGLAQIVDEGKDWVELNLDEWGAIYLQENGFDRRIRRITDSQIRDWHRRAAEGMHPEPPTPLGIVYEAEGEVIPVSQDHDDPDPWDLRPKIEKALDRLGLDYEGKPKRRKGGKKMAKKKTAKKRSRKARKKTTKRGRNPKRRNTHDAAASNRRFVEALRSVDIDLQASIESLQSNEDVRALDHLLRAAYFTGVAAAERGYTTDPDKGSSDRLTELQRGLRTWGGTFVEQSGR